MDFVWCITDYDNMGIYEIYSTFDKAKKAFIKNVICPTTIKEAVAECEKYNKKFYGFMLVDNKDHELDWSNFNPQTKVFYSYDTMSNSVFRVFNEKEIVEGYTFGEIALIKKPLL